MDWPLLFGRRDSARTLGISLEEILDSLVAEGSLRPRRIGRPACCLSGRNWSDSHVVRPHHTSCEKKRDNEVRRIFVFGQRENVSTSPQGPSTGLLERVPSQFDRYGPLGSKR